MAPSDPLADHGREPREAAGMVVQADAKRGAELRRRMEPAGGGHCATVSAGRSRTAIRGRADSCAEIPQAQALSTRIRSAGACHDEHQWKRRNHDVEGRAMTKLKDAAADFLSHKRVAVTGVSRTPGAHGSNAVYRRLRERGYDVFAVNPNADAVEGDCAYHDLQAIPGGVDAVVIGTRPELADETMHECADLGIEHVWMHRGPGAGSVSQTAAEYGRARGITVIDGGCPCMFGPTADLGHKAMRVVFTLARNVPRDVA
jgi:predicted CoA-binding protein